MEESDVQPKELNVLLTTLPLNSEEKLNMQNSFSFFQIWSTIVDLLVLNFTFVAVILPQTLSLSHEQLLKELFTVGLTE